MGLFSINGREWDRFKDFFNCLDRGAKFTTIDAMRETGLKINKIRGIIMRTITRGYLKVETREGKPDLIIKLRDMEEL